MRYAFPPGGLPDQGCDPEGAAIFTEAYAVLPAVTQRDIVTSLLPGWHGTRAWVLARPLSGFAETFAQYAVEVAPGGGSYNPEPEANAEAVLFVARGHSRIRIDGISHKLDAGGYAYISPDSVWALENPGPGDLQLHWIRKMYRYVNDIPPPKSFVTSDQKTRPVNMPDTGKWSTTRFVDPGDIAHDMHVNIVTLLPGGRIPFAETHVMEHGLYVLQGTARYLLNRDWVEVGPGDFMWLRAFCPQACVATGNEPFRYLLYKDVNRHPALTLAA